MSKDIFPTVYAIYQGHFYDEWAVKHCKDGYKRFVIDKKIKEIIPDKNFANLSQVVSSGCVIANGRFMNEPLKITLKNNVIRVDDILYEPIDNKKINTVTLETNQLRINHFNQLVKDLSQNKVVIFGQNKYGDRYGVNLRGICREDKLFRIDDIVKSDKAKEEKIKELKKQFNFLNADEKLYEDILQNWSLDRTVFYHCPRKNEMYQGRHIDCRPPFDTKDYCQKDYRKWIKSHCPRVYFVDKIESR